MTSSGKRYQIIILQNTRNQEKAIIPLLKLKDYFEKRGNTYKIISFEYGRLTRVLIKTFDNLLNQKLFSDPKKTLYEVNKCWVNNKVINTWYFEEISYKLDFEKIFSWFKKPKPKKKEEEND